MKFADLPIPEPVMAGIRHCGFESCTEIQAMSLPVTLAGRDVAGQAQTGTGKTAAFLIAAFTRLLRDPPPKDRQPPGRPRSLIIAPTRELAVQIEQDAVRLWQFTSLRVVAVYGGVDYEKQQDLLRSGPVDMLIGTPGRLIDYFKQKIYHCDAVEVLVIDEADRLFDMGFIVDLRFLLRRLPPAQHRLSMLFSATLSYRAQELSYDYLNQPEVVVSNPDNKTVEQVTQSLYHVEGRRKISLLVGLLRRDLAESGEGGSRVMIFVNTKRMGERLDDWLSANGMTCGYLSGDVPQAKRLKVLQRFQEGRLPILIATDVAGRGLHIDGITHVINYDLPENPEDYVHRIGRTARAGARGDAISLVDEEGAYSLEAIEAFIDMKLRVDWAEDELFGSLVRPGPSPPRERVERYGDRDRGRGASDIGRGGYGGGGGRHHGTASTPARRSGTAGSDHPREGGGVQPDGHSRHPIAEASHPTEGGGRPPAGGAPPAVVGAVPAPRRQWSRRRSPAVRSS